MVIDQGPDILSHISQQYSSVAATLCDYSPCDAMYWASSVNWYPVRQQTSDVLGEGRMPLQSGSLFHFSVDQFTLNFHSSQQNSFFAFHTVL